MVGVGKGVNISFEDGDRRDVVSRGALGRAYMEDAGEVLDETELAEEGTAIGMATGLGIESFPSAIPFSVVREPVGSRANRSRASTQRDARGQTSLHSIRIERVR